MGTALAWACRWIGDWKWVVGTASESLIIITSMPQPPLTVHCQVIECILMLMQILIASLTRLIILNSQPERQQPIPYHTSILSGHQWVLELIVGHLDHICCELGVWKEVFLQLLLELCQVGHVDSRRVTLEEEVAIFLYTCVTGLTVRHMDECFQRSNSTISW